MAQKKAQGLLIKRHKEVVLVREIMMLPEDFSYLGCKQKQLNHSKISVPHYPYAIYYAVDDERNEIIVITVRHTARYTDYDNV
jgi:mRNA-degrading endonuclease RelE of RelBE toxin-antitoxin system